MVLMGPLSTGIRESKAEFGKHTNASAIKKVRTDALVSAST
jgi:hypothetical protein